MYIYSLVVSTYLILSSYCFYNDVIINPSKINKNDMLEKYRKSYKNVLFNIIVTSYPTIYLATLFYNPKQFNIFASFIEIFICLYMSQIVFYFIHRCFHLPKLYKYHKIHHEYKVPSGMRAAYAHPIDFIFGNIFPLGITPILINIDIYSFYFIIIFSIHKTMINDHSEYKKDKDTNHHILHHQYFNYNYGPIWLDKYMNTLKTK